MFKIPDQDELFNLILMNTSKGDLDDIATQLKPFEIDWDAFDEHYLTRLKQQSNELCDCKFHQLARLHESQKTSLSPKLITLFRNEQIRDCGHDGYAKEQLGY